MQHIETEHHDGTSDATPGGYGNRRRPGELAFGALMLAASLGLLWSAYGISGFEALSAPGTVPMATALVMVVTAAIVVAKTARLPLVPNETLARDIVPATVLVFIAFLIAYGLLLKPLGFIPTSALFLIAAVRILSRRNWTWTLLVSLGSLAVVWLVFRIVFTVLMPSGIVPEAEFIQVFRNLFNGGGA
ncbi:tripartite tricarboxylate transporter TctB family protein [Roseibium salinum]|uniref:Tripartite tricarboxylate transporter TctB family protein n=1 Tax=Roseibium salinum TaxID=1604349 RepID=A0ABT3R1Y9_9HYPH|nr:tripartite tricarboxylate transporter TctB family protein [Roseibium sp. DSM 29163]MCX2723136.1 tripartite tricarboxylate transporter TctB family protein [Roseibium sp. DSM 29163]MDN3718933.1 tripartite tricarboxylate transporter TctB family protein [Roseibium salinum]